MTFHVISWSHLRFQPTPYSLYLNPWAQVRADLLVTSSAALSNAGCLARAPATRPELVPQTLSPWHAAAADGLFPGCPPPPSWT